MTGFTAITGREMGVGLAGGGHPIMTIDTSAGDIGVTKSGCANEPTLHVVTTFAGIGAGNMINRLTGRRNTVMTIKTGRAGHQAMIKGSTGKQPKPGRRMAMLASVIGYYMAD